MGNHFTALGDKQVREAKAKEEEAKRQREKAAREAAANASPDVKNIINNPELRSLLIEMKESPAMQKMLQECAADSRAVHKYMRDPVMGPKIRKLMEAGLLRMQ